MPTKRSGAQRRKAKAAATANNGTGTGDDASSTTSQPTTPSTSTPGANGVNGTNGFPSASSFDFDIESSMSDEEKAERRKDDGTKAYKTGQYTEALRLYSEAVRLAPGNPTYIFNRAAAQMALRRFLAAEVDCQTVVTMQKAEPSAKTWARLGKCQLALGKVEHAVATLENALTLEADTASAKADLTKCREVLADIANIERDRGRKDWPMVSMGVDRISRKVEDVPLAWRIWRLEALLGRKPPRIDEATVLANELVRSAPQNPDALYWRGMVMYRTGANDQAITHWKEALRCDPDYSAAKAAWNLAKALEAKKEEGNAAFKSGQLEAAIKAYGEAMAIDDTNDAVTATLLSNRATARLKLKQYDEALADCDACLALQPEHVKALRTQGKCHTALEQWEAAVGAFKQAYNNAPEGSQLERELQAEFKLAEQDLKRSKMKDHYKILGCDRHASEEEVKRAYRKASLQAHPDKPGGSEERFKELGDSYAVLSDARRRAAFDRGEDENERPEMGDFASAFGGGGFSPFFSSFGGGMGGGGGGGGGMHPDFEEMFGSRGGGGYHSHSFRGF